MDLIKISLTPQEAKSLKIALQQFIDDYKFGTMYYQYAVEDCESILEINNLRELEE